MHVRLKSEMSRSDQPLDLLVVLVLEQIIHYLLKALVKREPNGLHVTVLLVNDLNNRTEIQKP